MAESRRRTEPARTERILPGVWRIRLPLPWPGVPHVNVWAIARGDGLVLVDTGIGGEEGLRQLELGLGQAGFAISDISLLVCTHAHADHYGLAAPIVEQAGCELWMHPAWEHIRVSIDDPDAALDRRIEVARHSGVPPRALERYEADRRGDAPTIDGAVPPDRDLVEGVEVETDLGAWQVHFTPGHAPSHVVLHQPDRRLLLSGDQLLGRVLIFYDYGHTPDPVGEYSASLETIAGLEVDMCLSGHGRPFRDVAAKIEANHELIASQRAIVLRELNDGPRTAFEVVGGMLGDGNINPAAASWGLQIVLAYLDHLALAGEVEKVDGTDPIAWRLVK